MQSNFKKTTTPSKKIAKALLSDKTSKCLEDSELFSQLDKDYILNQLTKEENIKKRIAVAYTIDKNADWKSLKNKI